MSRRLLMGSCVATLLLARDRRGRTHLDGRGNLLVVDSGNRRIATIHRVTP